MGLKIGVDGAVLHRDAGGGNGSGGVVLGGEDVAGSPGDLSTEGSEGLDEDSGLDGWEWVRMGSYELGVRGRKTYSCAGNRRYGHQRGAGRHRTSHGWP